MATTSRPDRTLAAADPREATGCSASGAELEQREIEVAGHHVHARPQRVPGSLAGLET